MRTLTFALLAVILVAAAAVAAPSTLQTSRPIGFTGQIQEVHPDAVIFSTYGVSVRIPRGLVGPVTPTRDMRPGHTTRVELAPFTGQILAIARNSVMTVQTPQGLLAIPVASLPAEVRQQTMVWVQSQDGRVRRESLQNAWQMVLREKASVISTVP